MRQSSHPTGLAAPPEEQEFPANGAPPDLPESPSTCFEPVVGGDPVRLRSQQTFRVVDAKSGEPLGDVRVERLEGGYRPSSMPLVVLNQLSPAEKQTTNESGSVTFQKSGSKFMVNPSGKNPVYNHAYVTATWSGAKVCYPSEHREFSVTRKTASSRSPCNAGGSAAKSYAPKRRRQAAVKRTTGNPPPATWRSKTIGQASPRHAPAIEHNLLCGIPVTRGGTRTRGPRPRGRFLGGF